MEEWREREREREGERTTFVFLSEGGFFSKLLLSPFWGSNRREKKQKTAQTKEREEGKNGNGAAVRAEERPFSAAEQLYRYFVIRRIDGREERRNIKKKFPVLFFLDASTRTGRAVE